MTAIDAAANQGSEAFAPDDHARAVLNILEDFGEEKQRLVEMQRAVLNILEDLDIENRRAQGANRLKSEFLAHMSHELRTPLNAIMGFTSLMAHGKVGPVSAQQKEFLGDILKSSEHLLQLINDLLDLAKIEAGRIEFHAEPFDVAPAVEEVVAVTRALAQNKSIAIEVMIAASLPQARLDEQRLKQVLYNLISNAVKFTNDRGRVTVDVRLLGTERLQVEVRDTGIGIRKEDLARLFHRFEQLDSGATRTYGGTGLGLALTKTLVELQGGSINVESTYGAGTTFTVTLPLSTAGV